MNHFIGNKNQNMKKTILTLLSAFALTVQAQTLHPAV